MEQNFHNKVYINPNFKRLQKDACFIESNKTTHFNRHYHEGIPNRDTNNINLSLLNNRKIYINPNFISGNNMTQNNPGSRANLQYNGKNENMNTLTNPQTLDKYSLVQNVPSNCLEHKTKEQLQQKNMYSDIYQNNTLETNTHLDQSFKKTNYVSGVPLARSRYCIIRKKRKLSVNEGFKNKSNLSIDFVTSAIDSNQLTCYRNANAVKTCEMNKARYAPEKVMKIKISKYKTIPLSYLKKSFAVDNNKNKSAIPTIKHHPRKYVRLNSTSIMLNKNCFKFIKPNTPKKLNTPLNVSKIKTSSRITQRKDKSLLHNKLQQSASKVKLSRTNFKLNNIPCRLFTKYGKCLRQDQGNCKYLHDKKHVSLCRKFLKGICHNKDCSLSHELTAKKMPTCYFYLSGMCTKVNCPYLHVKLSDKTKICQEFTRGYCESGDKCPFKHQLKMTEKINTLKKKSQIKITKTRQIKTDKTTIKEKEIERRPEIVQSSEERHVEDSDCRYYKELVNEVSCETIKPTRCKLGTLPSFIHL